MVKWTEAADARLLVGILKTTNMKVDHAALAKYVGDGCTAKAIQHRLNIIKSKVALAGSEESTPPATPRKRKTAPKKSTVAVEEDDEDESDGNEDHDAINKKKTKA